MEDFFTPIKDFYISLNRGEKGKFVLWIQRTLEISQSTALLRIREDGWKGIERERVEAAIRDNEWR